MAEQQQESRESLMRALSTLKPSLIMMALAWFVARLQVYIHVCIRNHLVTRAYTPSL